MKKLVWGMSANKTILYILLVIVLVETFVILAMRNFNAVASHEWLKNASTTSALITKNDEVFKFNDELADQNKELWKANENLAAENKKILQANKNLAETLKQYCPECVIKQ